MLGLIWIKTVYLMIYLFVFPKTNFNQSAEDKKNMQIYPASKGLYKQF